MLTFILFDKQKGMVKNVFLFTVCVMVVGLNSQIGNAAKLKKTIKSVSSRTSMQSNTSNLIDKAVKDAVKTGTDELNKSVKVIVEDVKKDVNSVVNDAKKEIQSVQGTIVDVKNTIYSVKASFDKIILLLKVLIGMVGVLIALMTFTLINKVFKIVKFTKSIVDGVRGRRISDTDI